MHQTNIVGTENLLKVISELNCTLNLNMTLIFASSQEAIGPVPNNVPFATETTTLSPSYYYGDTKVTAEKMIAEYTTIPSTILRITGVTGPHDKYAAFEFIQAISMGLMIAYPGNCQGTISFVHVHDVINAIKLVIEKQVTGVYIIGPKNCLTYQQAIDVVADATGWFKPLFHCPMWLFRSAVGMVGPMLNMFRKEKNSFLFNVKTLDCMDEKRSYSSEKAMKDFGYDPMTMEEALRRGTKEHVRNGDISTAGTHVTRIAIFGTCIAAVASVYFIW
jgi:nucleoside-diphosphate-sugar epimerase